VEADSSYIIMLRCQKRTYYKTCGLMALFSIVSFRYLNKYKYF